MGKLDWSKCAPEGGWKERTYYVVDVTFHATNPVHRAILYTGFWDKRRNCPGGYSSLFQGTYEGGKAYVGDLYTVKVISEITDMRDLT